MKTRGVEVHEGYLVFPIGFAVPVQFWNRLKHEIAKAGRVEEFQADYASEKARVHEERGNGWSSNDRETEREHRLFRRWTERVVGAQALWPWQRGWTEALVDSYLTAPAAREAA